ncbi:alanine racemase [Lutibacter sp. B2]|nr:alanine racemase [Lutibacter sp. B2]
MLGLEKTRPVWVEINLDHLAYNMRQIRKTVHKDIKVGAVIKADGYGHGAVEIADTLLENGAQWLIVATLSEAVQLRKKYKEVPILILGYTPNEVAEVVIENELSQTVYNLSQAQYYNDIAKKLCKKVKIHIKIDTGMNRLGFQPNDDSIKTIKKISNLSNVMIEGMFTHFAAADQLDKSFTQIQYNRFEDVFKSLQREGVSIPIKHVGNSAAIMDLPSMHLDMVRAGIILYGLYPSNEVNMESLTLKPVLSVKARITHVKNVDEGVGIGYGLTYSTSKSSKIATLPVGYADGFTRMLSGKGEVLVKGHKVPIVGRICMDQCMINVTVLDEIHSNDEVILIGSDGKNSISADDIAKKLDTINYEIVCMIGRRVPRVYIKDQKIIKIKDYLLSE